MDITGTFIDISGTFVENLILLLVAITFTGFVIPLVLRRIDVQKHAAQERLRAALARQDKVIDAQEALLDSLADLLWEYMQRSVNVLYFHNAETGRPNLFETAVREYDTYSGPLLGKVRAEISKLLRLAPRPLYDEFLDLFYAELLPFDQCLVELARMRGQGGAAPAGAPERCPARGTRFDGASWSDLDAFLIRELAQRVDRAFDDLADALDLKQNNAAPGNAWAREAARPRAARATPAADAALPPRPPQSVPSA